MWSIPGSVRRPLASRIQDAEARLVITADVGYDRGKRSRSNPWWTQPWHPCPTVEKVVVVRRDALGVALTAPKEIDWADWLKEQNAGLCGRTARRRNPLYFLHLGNDRKAQRCGARPWRLHGRHLYITTKYVFDLKKRTSILRCRSRLGDGTQLHRLRPLLNGATILMAEGKPDYPNPGRWWDLIARYGVSIFYTTPTAVRLLLMKYGEDWPKKYDLSTLRVLGSVGEPINPEAWEWFYRVTGSDKPIMDTWWQNETGAILVTPSLRPAQARFSDAPVPGLKPTWWTREGNSLPANAGGFAVIEAPGPR